MAVDDKDECEVDGAMLLLFRIMRMGGVAPVRFRKHGSKTYIRLYPKLVYPGIVVTAIIIIIALIGFTLDITKKTLTTRMLPVMVDVTCTLVVVCLGTYGAANRIRRSMDYLEQLKKIQQNNNGRKVKKDEKYKTIYIICNLLLLLCGVCIHFFISAMMTEGDTQLILLCLLPVNYVGNFIVFLLGNWKQQIVQMINSSLNNLNDQLMDILEDLENDSNNVAKQRSKQKEPPVNVPLKFINKMIDNLAVIELERSASAFSKMNEMKLRQLLFKHIKIGEVIGAVNGSEGKLVLFVLLAYIVDVTNVIYDFSSTIRYADKIPMWGLYLVSHSIWCTFIVTNLVAIVNPCQRTTFEIDKTKGLVSRLMSFVTSDKDPVSDDLEIYFNHLMLFNSSYSPMGVVTLNRSFILTVFGGIVTCVLIFVDFDFRSGFLNV